MLRNFAAGLLLILVSVPGVAQVATGLYSHGSFDNPGFETVDIGSLNVHFSIPAINKAGRGMNFQYSLNYDGLIWAAAFVSGTKTWTPTNANATWGFSGQLGENLTGHMTSIKTNDTCQYQDDSGRIITLHRYRFSNFVYTDSFNLSHPMDYSLDFCYNPLVNDGPIAGGSGRATDGSGYHIDLDSGELIAPNGSQISAPANSLTGAGSITDSNGNVITNNGDGTFTDTTGHTALTITGSGTSSSPIVLTYKTATGGSASVTVYYRAYTVQTVFGCSGIGEYNQSANLVDHIVLGDGIGTYYFAYETTPGHSPNITGRLASITLPQGGVISYQYSGISCTDGTPTGLTRTSSDGSNNYQRTYIRSSITSTTSITTITDATSNHNQSTFNFVMAGNPAAFYETQRSVYNGTATGTALLSRQTCYNGQAPPCTTVVPTMPLTQIDTYETLDGIKMHGARVNYNSYGMLTGSNVYDFGGSTSRGPLLKMEIWAYDTSIVDLATAHYVYDSSTNFAGGTIYAYDGRTPETSSGVPQHVAVTRPRGNLTSVTQYTNNNDTAVSFSATYKDTGSILTSTTPSGSTRFSYDSTFVYNTDITLPTPSSGVSLESIATYDISYTGLRLTAKDPNNAETRIVSYDSMLRPTEIDFPDGGKTTFSYSPTQVGTQTYQDSGKYGDTETQLDGYGRPSRVAVANGQASPKNWYQQDVCYDANGNQRFSSYHYQANGFATQKVCSGAGDTSSYDGLGRLTSVTRQNGETVTYKYYGRATLYTDENGVSRISQIDGLGRTTIVCEVSQSTLQGISPTACGTDSPATGWPGTGFTTTYAYTLATPTTTITQGAQTRIFQTDWLGRTTSVTEPESGTTTYSYAYNSTGLVVTRKKPKANQSSRATLTTTTYQYDSLSRVVSVTYDDGTPTKTFAYDASAGWSDLTQSNLKGRMSLASLTPANANAKTIFSYDVMGRITDLDECFPSGCANPANNKKLHYTYDWAGNMLSSSDGGGVTSTYAVSLAGETLSLTSSLNNSTDPAGILSNIVNGPNGPVSFSLGNGQTGVYSYDNLGRISGGWQCGGGSASPNCTGGTLSYGFTSAWRGVRMTGSSDSVLNQTSIYGYDEFNRLASRTVTSGTVQNFSYVYDRYGNRVQQNVTAGSGPAPAFSFVPSTNQITPSTCNPPSYNQYCFDAAGNMIADGYHMYAFDADGNITAVDPGQNPPTATYAYDALNHRVQTVAGGTTTEFIYNANGRRVSTWNGANNTQIQGRYYWGSKAVAYYKSGAAHFEFQDWEGTERMRTAYDGGSEGTFASLPFGDALTTSSGTDTDPYHFAMLDHDAESSTEHATLRQFSATQGRWLGPDPYAGSYDFSNPQSLNRYVYVLDNPLFFNDPDGDDSNPSLCYLTASSCGSGGGGGGVGGGGAALAYLQMFANVYLGPNIGGGGGGGVTTNAPNIFKGSDGNWYSQEPDGSSINLGPLLYQGYGSDSTLSGTALMALNSLGQRLLSGTVTATASAGSGGGTAPNTSWQQRMRQATHWVCGRSPGERVAKSVLWGAGIGAVVGGVGGFVAGEVFGGEVTFGATGLLGAYLGAHVGGAVGGINGLTQGAVLAGICYAGFQYDN